MNIPKVSNMYSPRSGLPVANQFLIEDNGNEIFQSYETIIGVKDLRDNITLDEEGWNYSSAASKYRNQWLGLTSKEIAKQVKDGTIKLKKLN